MASTADIMKTGLAAHHAGRLDEAERQYRRVLRTEPGHAEALHCLGIIQHQAGQNERALGFFRRALRASPASSQLHNSFANALNALSQPQAALEQLDRAVALAPADATLHYNRGNTLMTLLRDAEAHAAFRRAVALNPGLVPAWQNKAVTETRLGLHEAALATIDHLIAMRQDTAGLRAKRGEALLALGRPADAVSDLEHAASALGDSVAQVNAAYALYLSGRGEAAIQAVDGALRRDPEFALAHWNAASICLSLGDYARGWREYEWRSADPSFRGRTRHFAQPCWNGEAPLAGRTILLHAEQGFGDTIQFCRYVPIVKALGASVVLEAPAPLLPVLRTLAGHDLLIAHGTALPDFDLHCPLMSLPLAFATILETVPAKVPYLAADPVRVATWRDRLGPQAGRRIGLAWSGSASFKGDSTRSAPLAAWRGLIRPGFDYIGLQRDIRSEDADSAANLGVRLFGETIEDFGDAAALSRLMDLVISVDSAPAHLAGAMGQPVWLMLHHVAEWRWLRGREDSPWYPTARLFRQASPLDWTELSGRVGDALEAAFSGA